MVARARTRRWTLAIALLGASGVLGTSTPARADDAPAPPPVAKTPTPDDGKTEVHIIGVSAVVLEQQVGDEWVEVCHASCDERVPVAGKYRVRGEGLKASEPFLLESRDGTAVLEVSPSRDRARLGVGLLVTGGVLGALGVATIFVAASIDGGLASLGTFLLVGAAGLTASVAGLVLLIVGGVVLQGRPTKVTQPDGDSTASVRRPMWATGLERVPIVGAAFVAPVLSVSF